jgi:hypothetical protein
MRLSPLCLMTALSVWLAGCLPESEHPIAPADSQGADSQAGDQRLWGAWLNTAEDGFIVAHALATETGTLRLVTVDHDVEGIGGVDEYEAHVTRLPQGDYLNVLVTGSETGYLIARYTFTDADTLSIAMTQNAALEAAVRSGALAGAITEEGGVPDLRITASSEQWQAFLAKPPAGLFGEELLFQRVGPAYVSE